MKKGEIQKISAKISITRPHGPNGSYISICIYDDLSGIGFFDGRMELSEFAECVTGLSRQPIPAEVRGLDLVGLKHVWERRSCSLPDELSHKRGEDQEEWIRINRQEEGWIVDPVLRSRNSTSHDHKTGITTAHYSVHKYIKPEEVPA